MTNDDENNDENDNEGDDNGYDYVVVMMNSIQFNLDIITHNDEHNDLDDDDNNHDDNDDDEYGFSVYLYVPYSHIYGILKYGKTHRQITI